MFFFNKFALLLLFAIIAGCGDNMLPSSEDKRPVIVAGSTGGSVTQKSPDFTISNINGTSVTLSSSLTGKKGAVFYFTMWCPICDSHINNMRLSIVPAFPDVIFFLVDYVSGSVSAAASAANGYTGGDFTILADTSHSLFNIFQATMGTTVVIDSSGVVKMNEDYRDGTKLRATVSALQ